MKLRQSLFLLVVLLVLVGLYGALQYGRRHQAEQAEVSKQVFSFAPENVQRLSITRIGEVPAVAERVSAEEWRIMEPNPTIVPFHLMWNRVATHLAGLANEHTVLESPADLAPYGLDTPALEVDAALADGTGIHVRFGALEPTGRYRYARLDEGTMFLVRKDIFFELDRSLSDLRHRYLVENREVPLAQLEFAWIWTDPPEDKDGRRIETGQEAIAIKVERADASAPWRVVSPFEALARHEKVEALASALQFALCKDFIDAPENLSDYGLQPARARITFKDAGAGEERTVLLGKADDSPDKAGLFVKLDGQDAVLVIDAPLLSLLPASTTEWRDLRLLTGRVSDIKELTYTRGNTRMVLAKDTEGGWHLTEPVLEATNEFAVNAFLRFIKEVEGKDFVEDAAAQDRLKNPEVRISLLSDNDAASEILLAPADTAGAWYARQDSGGIVSLDGVAVNMLLISPDTFQSLELLRFVKGGVRELQLTFEGREYQIARRHDVWTATAPEGFQVGNQADVETLLDTVCPLNAISIIEDTGGDAAVFGLETPVFSLTLFLGGAEGPPQEELSLDIGAVCPDNSSERFARSSARSGIFTISQEVMDKIREALRGFK
jgi:hypothetical protein